MKGELSPGEIQRAICSAHSATGPRTGTVPVPANGANGVSAPDPAHRTVPVPLSGPGTDNNPAPAQLAVPAPPRARRRRRPSSPWQNPLNFREALFTLNEISGLRAAYCQLLALPRAASVHGAFNGGEFRQRERWNLSAGSFQKPVLYTVIGNNSVHRPANDNRSRVPVSHCRRVSEQYSIGSGLRCVRCLACHSVFLVQLTFGGSADRRRIWNSEERSVELAHIASTIWFSTSY